MSYRFLLLDADGTLLDFKKAEAQGIKNALRIHQLPYSDAILSAYSRINITCWQEYERGLIDRDTLLTERFRRLFAHLGWTADAKAMQDTYHEELGKGAYLLEDAYDVCERLRTFCELYIVTNGVAATQHSRMKKSGLDRLVRQVFISEEIGFPKPQREYFERVFAQIPGFKKEEALIVGDSLTADIQGGINAGIATCWFNPDRHPRPDGMRIDLEIRRLRELIGLVTP